MKQIAYKLFFNAFSNKTRFEIVRLLRKQPLNVNGICKKTGFEQSRVSHNLKHLVALGFVVSERVGKKMVYKLDEKHIAPILENIDRQLEKFGERIETCGILKGHKKCKWLS